MNEETLLEGTPLDEQDAGVISRLCKDREVMRLLTNPLTVWKGVCYFQNTLDELGCMNYLHELAKLCEKPIFATPAQRGRAFLNVKLRR
jgi:hypothetical protein